MILPPFSPTKRGGEVLRSQLALEVALAAYSLIAALMLLRLLFKLSCVSAFVWSGQVVYRLTDPLLFPFAAVQVAQRPLLGAATLADLTGIGLVSLIPIILLIRNDPSAATDP